MITDHPNASFRGAFDLRRKRSPSPPPEQRLPQEEIRARWSLALPGWACARTLIIARSGCGLGMAVRRELADTRPRVEAIPAPLELLKWRLFFILFDRETSS